MDPVWPASVQGSKRLDDDPPQFFTRRALLRMPVQVRAADTDSQGARALVRSGSVSITVVHADAWG